MKDEDEVVNPENMIIDSPLPISAMKTEIILKQMRYSVGKIILNNETGTCFFVNIFYENQKASVLMTAYHVINEKNINNFKYITLNDDQITLEININKDTKIYYGKDFDITIIEIQHKEIGENKDKIKFLELDDIFKPSLENIYKNNSIYIPQYIKGNEVVVSFGLLKGIKDGNIRHKCCTEKGSSGSPILNILNNKVIGLHKGGGHNINLGSYLNKPIREYFSNFKKENEINLSITIYDKKHLFKPTYFLGEKDDSLKNKGNILEELNDTNTEIYINEKKYSFQKYFSPEKEGEYNIKIKFANLVENCSYMFYRCQDIRIIDMSNFNSEKIKNVVGMFE